MRLAVDVAWGRPPCADPAEAAIAQAATATPVSSPHRLAEGAVAGISWLFVDEVRKGGSGVIPGQDLMRKGLLAREPAGIFTNPEIARDAFGVVSIPEDACM